MEGFYVKLRGNLKYIFALMDDETRYWIAQEVADAKYSYDAKRLLQKTQSNARWSLSSGTKRVTKAIETGLATTGRLRIPQVLAKDGGNALTKYGIERESGLRHDDVVRNLTALLGIDWVKPLPTKPMKYRINSDDSIVSSLIEFFYSIGYI